MNDASTKTDGNSHQRTMRVIKRHQKDGESVERFEEDILNALSSFMINVM